MATRKLGSRMILIVDFLDAFGDAVGEGREDWSRAFSCKQKTIKLEDAPR